MESLNEREQLFVALGAAIGSNCVPCVEKIVPKDAEQCVLVLVVDRGVDQILCVIGQLGFVGKVDFVLAEVMPGAANPHLALAHRPLVLGAQATREIRRTPEIQIGVIDDVRRPTGIGFETEVIVSSVQDPQVGANSPALSR